MWTPTRLFAALLAAFSGGEEPSAPPPPPAAAVLAETPDAELPQPAEATVDLPTTSSDPGPASVELAQAPSLEDVVLGMQRKYEGTTDFSATFTQQYTYTVLKRTQESQGTVLFKKPGLMRWDYSTPEAKTFAVADGKLTIWQKDDHTVMVDHCFKQDGLTASVSFLWGAGKITEQFDVAWFPGQFGAKTDHHLQLTPKQPNTVFVRMILVVDPKSYEVKQSILVDPQGNVNRFLFSDLKLNRGVKKESFVLTIPAGVPQSRIPGTCDPKTPRP